MAYSQTSHLNGILFVSEDILVSLNPSKCTFTQRLPCALVQIYTWNIITW